jgi:Flp pilus assembly protein TadG
MKKLCIISKNMRKLWSCERGAVAPLVGVCAIMLVGSVAVAIDVGRGQVAQSKLQASLDAAGLAAGAMVGQNLSDDLLKPEARKYLDANFAGQTVDATITEFDLDLSNDNSVVTLEARASLPTTFMRIFGHDIMNVAARTEITRETTGLEVAMVLDITGSMNEVAVAGEPESKMAGLKVAAHSLINILFGSNETVDDLWIGIVPFSGSVNIGTEHIDWLADYATYTTKNLCVGWNHANWVHTHSAGENPQYCPTNNANVSTRTWPLTMVDRYMASNTAGWYFNNHSWRGCILERWTDDQDVTDETPEDFPFQVYFAPDTTYNSSGYRNNWRGPTNSSNANNGNNLTALDRDGDTNPEEIGANRGCPEYPITRMTNTKATLNTAIDDIIWPNGYTHINVGAVWGWRMLSPKWNGVWGGTMDANDLPLEYDEPLSQKAMILMTDGKNTMTSTSYTAYGLMNDGHVVTNNDEDDAEVALNQKTKDICDDMKEQGILIYSVVFGQGANTAAKDMLKYCASQTDYYFDSPSSADLNTAFKAIGDSLSKLRVSK